VLIFDYFTKYIKIQLKIILGMKMRKKVNTLYLIYKISIFIFYLFEQLRCIFPTNISDTNVG